MSGSSPNQFLYFLRYPFFLVGNVHFKIKINKNKKSLVAIKENDKFDYVTKNYA